MKKITKEQMADAKYFDIYEAYAISKEEAESEEAEMMDSILDAIYLKLKKANEDGENIYIEYKGERYYSLECENIDYCYNKVYKKTRTEHREEISTPVELDIDDSVNIKEAIEKIYKTLRHPFPAKDIYVEFGGKRLYSCHCNNIDYCYQTLFGITRSEYIKEEQKDQAKEYSEFIRDLDEAYEVLSQAQANGQNIYINFKGHKLYSLECNSVDYCYKVVVGQTREEFKTAKRNRAERTIQENERESQRKVPGWKAEAMKHIYPEREKEWDEWVNADVQGAYSGDAVELAIEVMKMLDENRPFDEIKSKFNDFGTSGASEYLVKMFILKFSKRGPEYIRKYEEEILNFFSFNLQTFFIN